MATEDEAEKLEEGISGKIDGGIFRNEKRLYEDER